MKTIIFSILLICTIGCSSNNLNPEFVSEKDGVKLYRIYQDGKWIYFTTPRGDVHWDETRVKMVGKMVYTETVPHQVPGSGK